MIATRYYRMGIEKNDYSSLCELGCLSRNGKIMEGVEYFNMAIRLFEAGGMQGCMNAQEKMGFLLTRHGPSKIKLFTVGACWLQMALNEGSEMAKGLSQNKRTEKACWSMVCFNCNDVAMGGESTGTGAQHAELHITVANSTRKTIGISLIKIYLRT